MQAERKTYELWNAVVTNDQDTCASLIDEHNINTYLQEETQNEDGEYARHPLLIMAIRQERLAIAHFLMNYEPDIWQAGPHGTKPLHWLAMRYSFSSHDIYHKLISQLAVQGQAFARDVYGSTPLHYAVRCGNRSMIQTLLQWKPVANFRDIHGNNPLHEAAQRAHEDIADMLITQSLQGKLTLSHPYATAIAEDIEELYDGNIDIYQRNNEGLTPLHLSIGTGNISLVRTLASHYHQNIDVFDYYGRTPLYYAVQMQHMGMISALVENGANPNRCTESGLSALHVVPQSTTAEGDIQLRQLIYELLSLGVSPYTAEVRKGDTPMHTAALTGHIELVRALLHNKVSADIQNAYQETPLFYAVQKENSDMVRELALGGAYVNARSYYQATPLHNAVAARNLEATKILLAYGARADLLDCHFLAPLHIAQWQRDDIYHLFFVILPGLKQCTSTTQIERLLDAPRKTRCDLGQYARIADTLGSPDAAWAIRYWLFLHE